MAFDILFVKYAVFNSLLRTTIYLNQLGCCGFYFSFVEKSESVAFQDWASGILFAFYNHINCKWEIVGLICHVDILDWSNFSIFDKMIHIMNIRNVINYTPSGGISSTFIRFIRIFEMKLKVQSLHTFPSDEKIEGPPALHHAKIHVKAQIES